MSTSKLLGGYTNVSDDERASRQPVDDTRHVRTYKPWALRTLTLVSFLLVLTTYLGLIEVLLHESHRPSSDGASSKRSFAIGERQALVTSISDKHLAFRAVSSFNNDSAITTTSEDSASTTTRMQGGSSTVAGGLLSITSQPTIVLSTAGGALISITSQPTPLITTTLEDTPMTTTTTPTSDVPQTPTSTIDAPISDETSTMTSTNHLDTSSLSTATATVQYTSFVSTTNSEGVSTSVLAVIVSKTTLTGDPSFLATAHLLTTSGSSPSATSTPWPLANLTAMNVVTVKGTFNGWWYFAAFYLPAILAVFIKAFWEIIFASFKMMEPFERLSKPEGASARQGLFAQYLSNSISTDSFESCFQGRTVPLVTALLYLFVTVLTTLAASSMTVRATQNCIESDGSYLRCNPVWVIDIPIIRAVEALLGVCIIFTVLAIFYARRRKTALTTNPSSIASIASLISQEAFIDEFRAVDPRADIATLSNQFASDRFHLGYYENKLGEHSYGITRMTTPVQTHPSHKPKLRKHPRDQWSSAEYSSLSNPSADAHQHLSSPWLSERRQSQLLDFTQLATTAGLLGIVAAYAFEGRATPFNDFFNSSSPWARLVMVAAASVVDIQWKRLEREVRITEPYRRMAAGNQPAQTTVLMALDGTCWSGFVAALAKMLRFRGVGFQTLVSGVAALSDFNIVAVATMVYSDGQMWVTLRVSAFLAVGITGTMVLVMLLTVAWWRRGVVAKMPRCPDTIGAVVSYLCASRFARDVNSARLVGASRRERDAMVIAAGWRFSFRWKVGLDGRERWCVDYDADEDDHGLVHSYARDF